MGDTRPAFLHVLRYQSAVRCDAGLYVQFGVVASASRRIRDDCGREPNVGGLAACAEEDGHSDQNGRSRRAVARTPASDNQHQNRRCHGVTTSQGNTTASGCEVQRSRCCQRGLLWVRPDGLHGGCSRCSCDEQIQDSHPSHERPVCEHSPFAPFYAKNDHFTKAGSGRT